MTTNSTGFSNSSSLEPTQNNTSIETERNHSLEKRSSMVQDNDETPHHPRESGGEESGSLKSEVVKCHDRLLTTLMTFDFSARRLPALAKRCALDEAYYAKAQRSIGEQISIAHSDLERLKSELESARQMQIQRALYERQAKSVLKKHAPRDQLNALLVAAERDYTAAVEESRALDAKMELRVRQFLPVLSSVSQLSDELKEEEAVEARRKVLELALLEKDAGDDATDLPTGGGRSRDDGGGGGGGEGGGGGGRGGGGGGLRKLTLTGDQEGGEGGGGEATSEQGVEGGGGSESNLNDATSVDNAIQISEESSVVVAAVDDTNGAMEDGEQQNN